MYTKTSISIVFPTDVVVDHEESVMKKETKEKPATNSLRMQKVLWRAPKDFLPVQQRANWC